MVYTNAEYNLQHSNRLKNRPADQSSKNNTSSSNSSAKGKPLSSLIGAFTWTP